MSHDKKISILLADDHPVVREGMAAILNNEPDIEVVAQANNGRDAVKRYFELNPDVVLMDLRMPELDGVGAITEICRQTKNAHIIVLTTYDGDEDIYRALRAGAQGYLLKDTPISELLQVIRSIRKGHKEIPSAIAAKLAERITGMELTERELAVLRLIAEGKNNIQIGQDLSISEGTVKFHVNHILSKLGATDRTQAAIIALKRGLTHLD